MLAGPTVSRRMMCKALARTCNALNAAANVDIDRSADDHAFLKTEATKLEPVRIALIAKCRAIEDFELGPGDLLQSSVELGDEVLDRGVRAGNTRTKLGLKGKTGLQADHAFGNRTSAGLIAKRTSGRLTSAGLIAKRTSGRLTAGATKHLRRLPPRGDKLDAPSVRTAFPWTRQQEGA